VRGQTLQIAPALWPDVILLDIIMPGMNGIEVSQRLRAAPTAAAIPQIAVSAELEPIEGRDDSAMLCYGIRQPLPRVLLAGA